MNGGKVDYFVDGVFNHSTLAEGCRPRLLTRSTGSAFRDRRLLAAKGFARPVRQSRAPSARRARRHKCGTTALTWSPTAA
jgi:hypothetical protein